MVVASMSKKKGRTEYVTTKITAEDVLNQPTTIRVSPEFAKHVSQLAKMKGLSIAQVLDEMFVARLREELINLHESMANELRSLPPG